ncbi:MAG: ribosome silencing factor [Chloroflexota bacterium]
MPRKKSDVTITGDDARAALPEPTPICSGLPRRRKPVPKASDSPAEQALNLGRRIVELASDKKASDIVLLEIGGLTTLADYFVICSGQSERQLRAIVEGIASALRDEGIKPVGKEGSAGAHWMLIDYGSVVVHVMAPPERDYYQLEKLWADAPLVVRLQ